MKKQACKNIVQRTTKTESGKRTIPLNNKAMEAIRHMKVQQAIGCPYVFATQTGEHIGYSHLFPTEDSLPKMLYLAMMNIAKKGTGRRQDWVSDK